MKTWFKLSALLLPMLLTAQQPSGNLARVEIPGVKGVLVINVGPSPWYLEFVPEDHWTMLHARQRPDRVIVTAQLRQVTFAAVPESCKSDLWPKMMKFLTGKTENLQESSYGGALRVEYTLTGTQEDGRQEPKSRHVLSYWGAGNLCAEVHLAKVEFAPQDQAAFEQLLASVRLFPDEAGLQPSAQDQSSSSTLMAQGSELYTESNYREALKFYEKAFALEKEHRTFDKDLFLDLIDQLAFCYRVNGNLAKARETLDYGLSQDAEYPIFHYDMACVYAQMGKLDESLGHLHEAYKYKSNASPGQLPPDPAEDTCFAKFAHDPRFTDALQKLLPQ
jgi:tetratricopeptide (TPR) repeat protein